MHFLGVLGRTRYNQNISYFRQKANYIGVTSSQDYPSIIKTLYFFLITFEPLIIFYDCDEAVYSHYSFHQNSKIIIRVKKV